MRKKGISVALLGAVMSLHNAAMTKLKVGAHFLEEFKVSYEVYQGSVLSPLLIAIVTNAVTNEIKEERYKKYCARMT